MLDATDTASFFGALRGLRSDDDATRTAALGVLVPLAARGGNPISTRAAAALAEMGTVADPALSLFDTPQETANFIAYHEDMARREGYADPAGWAWAALRDLDIDLGARPGRPRAW